MGDSLRAFFGCVAFHSVALQIQNQPNRISEMCLLTLVRAVGPRLPDARGILLLHRGPLGLLCRLARRCHGNFLRVDGVLKRGALAHEPRPVLRRHLVILVALIRGHLHGSTRPRSEAGPGHCTPCTAGCPLPTAPPRFPRLW